MRVKECSFLTLCLLAAAALEVTSAQIGREPYPAECTKLEDCDNLWRHGEAFACSNGKCTCHPQATFDNTNKSCKCNPGFTKNGTKCEAQQAAPSSGPVTNGSIPAASAPPAARAVLGTCVSNSDCLTNARCLPTGCECNEGYKLISNACRLLAKNVGDLCEFDDQCQNELGGHSKCENTKCVCMTHSVPIQNNTQCIAKKELGERCTHKEQCNHIQHGTCNTDVCLCDPGFVSYEASCLAVVDKYNAVCNVSVQCQNGKLGYGSRCKASDTDVDLTVCACEEEYFYSRNSEMCLFAKGLGDTCDGKNDGCYLPNDSDNQRIECKNKICSCAKGYKSSEDKSQCENAGVINHVSLMAMTLSLLIYATRCGNNI